MPRKNNDNLNNLGMTPQAAKALTLELIRESHFQRSEAKLAAQAAKLKTKQLAKVKGKPQRGNPQRKEAENDTFDASENPKDMVEDDTSEASVIPLETPTPNPKGRRQYKSSESKRRLTTTRSN